jgi:hypothetical protein
MGLFQGCVPVGGWGWRLKESGDEDEYGGCILYLHMKIEE